MAGKVRAAFQELSPKRDGLVPWSRLEDFFHKLEVEPKAIKVCQFLVDDYGIIDTSKLFDWLYDGMAVDYEEGLRLHYGVPASRWCVTRDGFGEFLEEVMRRHEEGRIQNRPDPRTEEPNPFHDDMDIGPNMHAVNLDVIKPRTALAGGMSWALMLNPGGLHSDFFFVTHSWKEGVYEFSRKVLNHWQNEALAMWCCFLANPQTWQRQDLNQLLGERFDLMDSPFMQALADERLHSFVVVPNVTESLYCRLWCVAELWKAMEVQKMRGQQMIHVAKDAVKHAHKARPSETIAAMIHGASCSDENDEKRIRAYISGNEVHIQDMIKSLASKKKGHRWTDDAPEPPSSLASHAVQVLPVVPVRGHEGDHHAATVTSFTPTEPVTLVAARVEEPMALAHEVDQRKRQESSAIPSSLVKEECRFVASDHSEEKMILTHRHMERDEERRFVAEIDYSQDERHALEERILEIREEVELRRLEELEVEKMLMLKVEHLELSLEDRRRSIVERTGREHEREEALSKYLRLLEDAEVKDLEHEIRQRRHSAVLKEEKLQQQLAGLAAEPLNEAVELEAERDKIEERLQQQTTLRRQLESLEKTEGTDSVRRHLVAIKQAEMVELHKEMELHRREDEEKEQPMRQRLKELHEDWERFRAESESKRQAFEEHEEKILHEIETLRATQKEAETIATARHKKRDSKSRVHERVQREAVRAEVVVQVASRDDDIEVVTPELPSPHSRRGSSPSAETTPVMLVPQVHSLAVSLELEEEEGEDDDDLLFI
eukprot:s89_g18.t2